MAGYIGTQPVPQATQTRDAFTATNNQTSFPTSGYTPEFLDVFLNGVKLAAADYTATNGSDVVLAAGATTGDILEVVSYGTFEVLNPTFDGNVTFTGNASFGDNDKAIFGDGSDLQIYHDGSASRIVDAGSGGLTLQADANVVVQNSAGTETKAEFTTDGGVNLYYDNNLKLATTSTGIDVTGTVTSGGLQIGDNQWIYAGNGADLKLGHDGTDSIVRSQGAPLYIDANGTTFRGYSPYTKHMNIATNGDISFYEDTGTTAKFFWDASAEALGIGVVPQSFSPLMVNTATDRNIAVFDNATGATIGGLTNAGASAGLRLAGSPLIMTGGGGSGAEHMRIDSLGNLLIGKTSAGSATGVELASSGQVAVTRDGAVPAFFRRNTSDGSLIDFNKDGSTVGTIGTAVGYLTVGGATLGLKHYNPNNQSHIIHTVEGTTDRDGVTSLGYAGSRFKDLYLSDGVYLGGTGAANKLDDYEEGSWTPVIDNGTYSYSYRRGHYVKIGKMVYAHVGFKINTASSVGGANAAISGLPFLSESYGGYQEPQARCAVAGFCVTANLSSHLSFYIVNNGTIMYARTSANNNDTAVNSNALWQNGTFIKLTMIYTTNA